MNMTIRLRAGLFAFALGLVFTTSSPAAPTYARYYVDQLYIGNALEEQGGYFQGRKFAVDNAYCLGLRRFGVQTSDYGLDKFWRFKCTLNGANGHTYETQISTTHGPKTRNVYWHFLSTKRLY